MSTAVPRDAPTPDEAGFRSWMAVRGPVIRRKAYLMTGDWYAADDLAQDVLVTVYSRWTRVARGSNVDAYANRVLVGKYVDSARRPWRRDGSRRRRPRGRLGHGRLRRRRGGRQALQALGAHARAPRRRGAAVHR